MLGNKKRIDHHYLSQTDTGYFFKYGVLEDQYPFLRSVGSVLNMKVDEIKITLAEKLNDSIYTSIGNGDIKTQFGDKENYIKLYIEQSDIRL